MSKGDFIFPAVGSRTRKQLSEALGAMSITLTGEESSTLERIASNIAGTRYDAHHMQMLDSERAS